jgi:hypothetical protein
MSAHPGSRRLLGTAVAIIVASVSLTACNKAPSKTASTGLHPTLASDAISSQHPAIEPAALQILQATSRQLTGAKSLTFTAVTTYEAFARTGQPLYYTTQSSVLVQHPDKLRVLTPGDGPASDFYYDGKVMTAYSPREQLFATTAAPPTMEAMLKTADDQASITFPFSPLLAPDPYKNLTNGLTSAFVVGQSHVVGDTITDIVAFTNRNVQAEVWIGIDDGLPRMLRAVYRNDPHRLRYQMEFRDWRRNVDLAPAAFVFTNTSDAHVMQFARPDAPVQGARK